MWILVLDEVNFTNKTGRQEEECDVFVRQVALSRNINSNVVRPLLLQISVDTMCMMFCAFGSLHIVSKKCLNKLWWYFGRYATAFVRHLAAGERIPGWQTILARARARIPQVKTKYLLHWEDDGSFEMKEAADRLPHKIPEGARVVFTQASFSVLEVIDYQ